jgi:hypothetical protein
MNLGLKVLIQEEKDADDSRRNAYPKTDTYDSHKNQSFIKDARILYLPDRQVNGKR